MKINNLEKAVSKLQEALSLSDDIPVKVDACIKRFEFTYEVCKKTLRFAVQELGFSVSNPREVLRYAGQQGFLHNISLWDKMREDRNDSSHEYDEEKALEIYRNIPEYAKEFEFVLNSIKRTFKEK